MKRLIMIIMTAMAFVVAVNVKAQSPIKVTVPPFGDEVTLQPLKSGSYEIGYVLDQNNLITAYGTLYVDNQEGVGLKVGMVVLMMPEKTKVYVSGMSTIQGWLVEGGNKFVTYDMESGSKKADIGYGTVWAYSKKYNALKIDGGGKTATVLYDPKSYKKMTDVQILEKIFEISDQPGAFDLSPVN